MTKRAPSFARAFTGRWRITEMYEWDEIDLAGSAHINFSGKDRGEIAFLVVEADLDLRYGSPDPLCDRILRYWSIWPIALRKGSSEIRMRPR